MALSKADKEEIAAMFNAFADRMGSGQQSRPAERLVYDTLTGQVIPAIQPTADAFSYRMGAGAQVVPIPERLVGGALETALVPSRRKKAMTKFNRAVKEGMKIVKASKSYGKKGTISNSKKAFAAVTKTVSKANKGAKLSPRGVLRKVGQKAGAILKKAGAKKGKRKQKKGRGALSFYGRKPWESI
tara:strand:- start:29 stop:586 length:558 start_codon:yes stop_codon:yes gene_type:complete